MSAQIETNNQKAVTAIRKAYKERKLSKSAAMWLLSGVKI